MIPGVKFAGNVLAVAVGVGGVGAFVYWLLTREGGDGVGLGLGTGKGGETLFGAGGGGPSDKPGDADKPGGDGSSNHGQQQGSQGGGGTKPTQKPGDGGQGGTGGKGGDGDGGGGGDGGDGGLGGGKGGGVGQGEGEGTSEGGEDEGGDEGDDDGGGPDEGKYDPWGGQLIAVDLDPPDLSDSKLKAVHATIYELVAGSVLVTDLPPPLHGYDPNLGGLLLFWADVALHSNYKLPPGRLDPDNKTHIPWINLWLDILSVVTATEQEINKDFDEDVEDEPGNQVLLYGIGRDSISFRSFRFRSRSRRQRNVLRDPLRRLLAGGRW